VRIDNDPKLDFDDVLIRPKRSEAPSRSAIVLDREYTFLNSGQTWQGIPLVAANMDTVGTMAMADALGPQRMLTCLHKYYADDALADFFAEERHRACAFFTTGIKDDEVQKLERLMARVELRLVCIDVANGYTISSTTSTGCGRCSPS